MYKYDYDYIYKNNSIETKKVLTIIDEVIGEEFFQDPLGFMEEHCYDFEDKEKLIKEFISTYQITILAPDGHDKIREFFEAIETNIYDYLIDINVLWQSETFKSLDEDNQKEVADILCDIMLNETKEQLIIINIYNGINKAITETKYSNTPYDKLNEILEALEQKLILLEQEYNLASDKFDASSPDNEMDDFLCENLTELTYELQDLYSEIIDVRNEIMYRDGLARKKQ